MHDPKEKDVQGTTLGRAWPCHQVTRPHKGHVFLGNTMVLFTTKTKLKDCLLFFHLVFNLVPEHSMIMSRSWVNPVES